MRTTAARDDVDLDGVGARNPGTAWNGEVVDLVETTPGSASDTCMKRG